MAHKILSIGIFCTALLILLGLSYWQVERLQWKSKIIDRLESEYNNPLSEEETSFEIFKNYEIDDLPLIYGQISGKFIYNKEIFVGPKPYEGEIGYHIITPLKLKNGSYILVNRGWVNESKRNTIQEIRPSKTMQLKGIFRKPEWNSFTPENSPENDIWTKLDIEQISDVKNITPVSPLMLYADYISTSFSPTIILQKKRWYPRNKHLQYAIFWFSMALALITVFGMAARKKK